MNQPNPTRDVLTIRNAILMSGNWRNFRGEKRMYTALGDKFFNMEIDPALAQEMIRDHWNVKPLKMREGDVEQKYYLTVKLNYNSRNPPAVWRVNSAGKMPLDESTVGQLDISDITKADVQFVGFRHGNNPQDPLAQSAFLLRLYATVYEDPLDLEYGHIPYLGDVVPTPMDPDEPTPF